MDTIMGQLSPRKEFDRSAVAALTAWKNNRVPNVDVPQEVRAQYEPELEPLQDFDVEKGLKLIFQVITLAGNYGYDNDAMLARYGEMVGMVQQVAAVKESQRIEAEDKETWLSLVHGLLTDQPSDVIPSADEGILY